MFKFLILFPFALCAGVFGFALMLPLLAILPLLLAIGLAVALPLLILRVLLAVFCGLGHLFIGLISVAAVFAGFALLVVVGVVGFHLLLPLLLLAGLVWLIRRAARPAPLQLEHHPG